MNLNFRLLEKNMIDKIYNKTNINNSLTEKKKKKNNIEIKLQKKSFAEEYRNYTNTNLTIFALYNLNNKYKNNIERNINNKFLNNLTEDKMTNLNNANYIDEKFLNNLTEDKMSNLYNLNNANFIETNYKDDLFNVKKYIDDKIIEKNNNMYNPDKNNKKILVVIAAHNNTELKLNTIKKTINFFNFKCIDIMVANTKSLKLNSNLHNFCKKKNVFYYEIENIPTFDFGKWIYLLSKKDLSSFDFIFFTNDSFIIEKPITHFINLTVKNNLELYGYNDSSQICYHYQSYLFAIKSDVIYKFIDMFNSKKDLIKNQNDLIEHFELQMKNYFSSFDCFLNIANISFQKYINIFFENDYLYKMLKDSELLPFTKIKRLLREYNLF